MTTAPVPDTLWNRSFLLWWLGSAQSAGGSALAGIATSFLVLEQTGSAGAMGVNLALALLPALVSPLFGTLVDRLPIRGPLLLGNLLRAALQLGVGIAALQGPVPLEALHAAAFLTGLVGAFFVPASMGVTPRLVPPHEVPRASGLMQGTTQTMQLVGLVGGGTLVTQLGSGWALVIDGASFLLFGLLLTQVRFPSRTRPPQGEGFWFSFAAGVRYVRGSPLLMGLPLMALVVNATFAPLEMLLPKRMLDLGAGATGYGLYWGFDLGGMVVGSLILAGLGARLRPRPLSVVGLATLGIVMLMLAFTHTAGQLYVLAVVMGLANAMTNVSIAVLFQTRVQAKYYGRVGSLLNMVGTAGQPVTLLALAPVADQLPIALIFGVGGGVTLLSALGWARVVAREAITAPPPHPA